MKVFSVLLFLDSLPSNEAVHLTINRRTPSGAVECKEVNNDPDTNDFGSAHPDSNCPNAAHSELSVKKKLWNFTRFNLFDDSTDSE
ncbi:uncharacterized protein LOC136094792 isoform X2 [Hydra vulgaris]|uniref:uncharacterized protein LOC136094792 isoform X2 n=1 Tax=Hydra vulgaris TaxID=6087 RepID=UPI0032EA3DAA